VGLAGTVLGDDVHGPARERDDDSRVIVPVHGEWGLRHDNGFPYLNVLVVELGKTLRLLRSLLGAHDPEDDKRERKE
jgi:hypothetical protein